MSSKSAFEMMLAFFPEVIVPIFLGKRKDCQGSEEPKPDCITLSDKKVAASPLPSPLIGQYKGSKDEEDTINVCKKPRMKSPPNSAGSSLGYLLGVPPAASAVPPQAQAHGGVMTRSQVAQSVVHDQSKENNPNSPPLKNSKLPGFGTPPHTSVKPHLAVAKISPESQPGSPKSIGDGMAHLSLGSTGSDSKPKSVVKSNERGNVKVEPSTGDYVATINPRNDDIAETNPNTNVAELSPLPTPHRRRKPCVSHPTGKRTVIPKNDITHNDVYCGQEAANSDHPGNLKYRAMIADNKATYLEWGEQHGEKTKIRNKIVNEMLDGGSRFIRKNTRELLTLKEVETKVSQSLREKEKN